MKASRSLKILLVEDNPSDVVMFREALASADRAVDLEVFWNGQEALDRLRAKAQTTAPRPDVMVLDVNMPILSGRELLAEMAADRDLATIPVVILTGSRFEKDSLPCDPDRRCIFIVKPFDFLSLVEVAKRVVAFADACRGASKGVRPGGAA